MNEIEELEELEAAHNAAYYAYLDADRAAHADRYNARADMFSAARTLDSAIDYENKINLN